MLTLQELCFIKLNKEDYQELNTYQDIHIDLENIKKQIVKKLITGINNINVKSKEYEKYICANRWSIELDLIKTLPKNNLHIIISILEYRRFKRFTGSGLFRDEEKSENYYIN